MPSVSARHADTRLHDDRRQQLLRIARQRIATRTKGTLNYLLTDHLGSTSVVIDQNGGVAAQLRYKPFGEPRGAASTDPTDRQFTGQRAEAAGYVGQVYDFNARLYSPVLGRFLSADSIIQSAVRDPQAVLPLVVSYAEPGLLAQWNAFQRSGRQAGAPHDPQLLNRYTYARNNPLAYRDDTGHFIWCIVGGVVGGVVGFGAYALTHQDNFDWGQAALWTGGGVLVGATFGAGALSAEAAAAATAGTTAATAACADGNCLNEVQATQKIIETGWTVIGKYPAYLDKARQWGASALNVSMAEWNALGSRAAQWARNVQFLDEAITRGDSFHL